MIMNTPYSVEHAENYGDIEAIASALSTILYTLAPPWAIVIALCRSLSIFVNPYDRFISHSCAATLLRGDQIKLYGSGFQNFGATDSSSTSFINSTHFCFFKHSSFPFDPVQVRSLSAIYPDSTPRPTNVDRNAVTKALVHVVVKTVRTAESALILG